MSGFFFGDFRILLDLALGLEDQRIHIVLQFVGEFHGIEVGLKNIVMTNEVDAHVRGKLKFVSTRISHAQVRAEEVIEAAAALGQFLGIHEERYREVIAGHGPSVASVVAAFECAPWPASGPANGGQLLSFLLLAKWRQNNRTRQNRSSRERKFCPQESGTRHECKVYLFCAGVVTARWGARCW